MVFFNGCNEDDGPPEKVDYEVDVKLEGDVEEFLWSLALDTEVDGFGLPNKFEDNPPRRSFFQTGDLDPNVTHKFKALFVDKIKIRFTNFLSSTSTKNENYSMKITITIRKGDLPVIEGEVAAGVSEIGNFSKEYQIDFTTQNTDTEFIITSVKENNTIECAGNACP